MWNSPWYVLCFNSRYLAASLLHADNVTANRRSINPWLYLILFTGFNWKWYPQSGAAAE